MSCLCLFPHLDPVVTNPSPHRGCGSVVHERETSISRPDEDVSGWDMRGSRCPGSRAGLFHPLRTLSALSAKHSYSQQLHSMQAQTGQEKKCSQVERVPQWRTEIETKWLPVTRTIHGSQGGNFPPEWTESDPRSSQEVGVREQEKAGSVGPALRFCVSSGMSLPTRPSSWSSESSLPCVS